MSLSGNCNIDLTYCKSYAPDIDRITPLNEQKCLRSSIHDRHDISSVGTRAKSGFSKVGEQKWPDLWLHEAGKVDGPVFKFLARNGIRQFIFFQLLEKGIVLNPEEQVAWMNI